MPSPKRRTPVNASLSDFSSEPHLGLVLQLLLSVARTIALRRDGVFVFSSSSLNAYLWNRIQIAPDFCHLTRISPQDHPPDPVTSSGLA
jgi:hypothetical protein